MVDLAGREIGLADLGQAHRGVGQLHRAFTAVLFDAQGRVLLAQRASSKPLWPGWWDATVASHPRQGEAVLVAGERRLQEELGVEAQLIDLGTFNYFAPFGGAGSERESCSALFGWLSPGQEPNPHPEEIAGVLSVELERLFEDSSLDLCPWAWLAFELALRSSDPRLAPVANYRNAIELRLHKADFERL